MDWRRSKDGMWIEIVDDTGRVRLRIQPISPKQVRLTAHDASERVVISACIMENGDPNITAHDAKGRERISATVDAQGDPQLILKDEFGRPLYGVMTWNENDRERCAI